MQRFDQAADARLVLRALFVSDLHLGAEASRAEAFLDFLRSVEAEYIYLVGDIFELWSGARIHWSAAQVAVLAELQARKAAGARVVYLPGNHDLAHHAADFAVRHGFEQISAHRHVTLTGRCYLVLHGDQFDAPALRSRAMTRIGVGADDLLRGMDRLLDRVLGRFLRRSVRPGGWLVRRFHLAVLLGHRHEWRLTRHARDEGCHGVICGHFHLAALRRRDGITYANCGDWIESLTALAEDPEGALQLLRWTPATRALHTELRA